jgi:hypothetical protein
MNPHNSAPVILPQSDLPEGSSEVDKKGNSLTEREPGEESEEFTYDPVRPRKSVTVSVRYRVRGRGQPLPYPLDEGDGQ